MQELSLPSSTADRRWTLKALVSFQEHCRWGFDRVSKKQPHITRRTWLMYFGEELLEYAKNTQGLVQLRASYVMKLRVLLGIKVIEGETSTAWDFACQSSHAMQSSKVETYNETVIEAWPKGRHLRKKCGSWERSDQSDTHIFRCDFLWFFGLSEFLGVVKIQGFAFSTTWWCYCWRAGLARISGHAWHGIIADQDSRIQRQDFQFHSWKIAKLCKEISIKEEQHNKQWSSETKGT